MQADWSKIATESNRYLSHLASLQPKAEGEWRALLDATPKDKREPVLTSKVRALLAEVLNSENPDSIDVNKGFFELGMDSLMAVDFKNRLQNKLGNGMRLHNTVAFDYSNIVSLSTFVFEKLFPEKVVLTDRNSANETEKKLVKKVDEMTLSDLNKLADDFLSED
jgi:acyl carrier protein